MGERIGPIKFDEIGYWSEIKLDIVKEYAAAYSTIFSAKGQRKFQHIYVDAFAGAGVHISRLTGEFVPGSPLNALWITPPFREYHFIDLDRSKVAALRKTVGNRPDVWIYEGDCNEILLRDVFPRIQYKEFKRGLCLLDPYGLHLNWKTVLAAAQMETIEIFLNFPIADMNRNVLWRHPEGVSPLDIDRMNAFWDDESWRAIAYSTEGNLFGFPEKEVNEVIARAFRERLRKTAGFALVSEPLPMRNSRGSIIYYLLFASHNTTGGRIVRDILLKYRARGL